MKGHLKKGIITFRIYDEGNGKIRFTINSKSEVDQGAAKIFKGTAREKQAKSWDEVLDNVVEETGGEETEKKIRSSTSNTYQIMFYVYTILVPMLILVINYLITKPRKASGYVNLLLKTIAQELGYAFFIYYLDKEQHIDTGWTFYTLIFFLIPITAIVLLLKLLYLIKNAKKKRHN